MKEKESNFNIIEINVCESQKYLNIQQKSVKYNYLEESCPYNVVL